MSAHGATAHPKEMKNRWVFDRVVIPPWSVRTLDLSLAFQAQFPAVAQPSQRAKLSRERKRAAMDARPGLCIPAHAHPCDERILPREQGTTTGCRDQ